MWPPGLKLPTSGLKDPFSNLFAFLVQPNGERKKQKHTKQKPEVSLGNLANHRSL